MFTSDQITQLTLKVNRTFAAQLELTEQKQHQNGSPTLHPITPRPPTPLPSGFEQVNPFKNMAKSMDRALEASDKLGLQRIENKGEDIDALRNKAVTLKNEYRQCFMSFSGDASPDQANALYSTAKEQAELVFKAAYKDPNRDSIEDAKAQFILSFTMALIKLSPVEKPLATASSSPESTFWSQDLLCLNDSDSEVEDISTAFKTINL